MQNTNIAWCDHTHNFWIGCSKDGPDCLNCYAEADMATRRGIVQWGPAGTRKRTTEKYWDGLRKLNSEKWLECFGCGWRGNEADVRVDHGSGWECPVCQGSGFTATKQRVFTLSLGDMFEKRAELAPWRRDALLDMVRYNKLTYLVLTKRPDEAPQMIEDAMPGMGCAGFLESNPHILIGCSAGNQAGADRRVGHLLNIPGNRNPWISVEPMIGAVDLTKVTARHQGESINALHKGKTRTSELQWVIVGGESQAGARPMHPAWAEKVLDDCTETTFFFKQWGEWLPMSQMADREPNGEWKVRPEFASAIKGKDWGTLTFDGQFYPETLPWTDERRDPVMVVRVGRKKDPHTLNGVQHFNWPAGHRWN